jgi:hypothetical protein
VFGIGKKIDRKVAATDDVHIWNGWTQGLIERLNGVDRLTFHLNSFQITSCFDGEEYAAEARHAKADLENYERMPLLFDGRPAGRPGRMFGEVTAELQGLEIYNSIYCEVEILRVPLATVIEHKRSGFIILDASDPIAWGADESRQFRRPTILLKLYDPDWSVLDALRQAFRAAVSLRKLPEMRVLLSSKVDVPVVGFGQAGRRLNVSSVIVWETWGQQPL